MIGLCATLKARPGKEKELEAVLLVMVNNAKQEKGTVQYILHTADDDPSTYFFYEQYVDEAALNHHASTDYFKERFSQAEALLREAVGIATYKILAAK